MPISQKSRNPQSTRKRNNQEILALLGRTDKQVGIYLTGPGSNLTFATDATISLSAPKDGPLAGLLIYDDPYGASAPATPAVPLPVPVVGGLVSDVFKGPPREHKILSDNAECCWAQSTCRTAGSS